jgi:hypothetical protein
VRRVAFLLVAACSGGTGGPDAAPSAPDAAPGEVAGELTVLDGGGLGHMWRAPLVFGGFPTEPPVWHTEVLADGACRVLAYEPAFCDPPCDGVCVAPGACVAWPTYRSAGSITVEGLAAPLVVDPSFDASYITFGGLPDPLFSPGATITLAAAGSEIDAFSLSAPAPARVAVPAYDAAGTVTLPDEDLALSWPDPDPAARIRIIVHSGGAPHGTPPATVLTCDAPDTGSLAIPRAAIAALPSLGVGCIKGHDCARFGIARYHQRSTLTSDGLVFLTVAAGTTYNVLH